MKRWVLIYLCLVFGLTISGCRSNATEIVNETDGFTLISSFSVSKGASAGTVRQVTSYVTVRYTNATEISTEEYLELRDIEHGLFGYVQADGSGSYKDQTSEIFQRNTEGTLQPKYQEGDVCVIRYGEQYEQFPDGEKYYKATIAEIEYYVYAAKIHESGAIFVRDYQGNITYYSADYIEIVYFGTAEAA